MAKVGVIKINSLGKYVGQTTYDGARIDMHYGFRDNKFYFKKEDLLKLNLLKKDEWFPLEHESKNEAISMLERLICNNIETEKYLYLKLGFDHSSINIKDNGDFLKKVNSHKHLYCENSSKFSIEYGRCLKFILPYSNTVMYQKSDNFIFDQKNYSNIIMNNSLIIKYTDERELFLKNIVNNLKIINKNVYDFFSESTNSDTICDLIDSNNKNKNILKI